MKLPIRKGVGFGLTSAIITTLGLIVGLNSSTHSVKIILAGILLIAISDALSDAMGMHISEESDKKKSVEHVWGATIATFFSKLIFALTFIIPFLIFEINIAVGISIVWGLVLISIFSFYVAKLKKDSSVKIVLEHLALAIIVILVTHYVGIWISSWI